MKTKNNLAVLVLSSVVCVLPVILSAAVYGRLPEQIAVHWNGAGEPDGFAPKFVAAFGLPLLFLAVNLYSKIQILNDPKRANTSGAMQLLAAWVVPLLSLILVPVTLFIAIGVPIPISLMAAVLVGIVLIVCGNYLPKSRQNYTIGIKLPWTLHSADIWNKTHRLAGYLYISGGILLIAGAFLLRGRPWLIFLLNILIVALLIVVPFFYSYLLYKKTHTASETDE